jgi:hypothetical protein
LLRRGLRSRPHAPPASRRAPGRSASARSCRAPFRTAEETSRRKNPVEKKFPNLTAEEECYQTNLELRDGRSSGRASVQPRGRTETATCSACHMTRMPSTPLIFNIVSQLWPAHQATQSYAKLRKAQSWLAYGGFRRRHVLQNGSLASCSEPCGRKCAGWQKASLERNRTFTHL